MSLSAEIREQLISSFRAELAEHVQTMTDGLLGLEQHRVDAKDSSATLEDIFRAAHSLVDTCHFKGYRGLWFDHVVDLIIFYGIFKQIDP